MADRRLEYRWIDRQADFDDLVVELLAQPRYALDTEFHRERTYYPKLALVQVAWRTDDGQQLALVDPLAVDVTGFSKRLFVSDALCVIHAAQQDLDVLTHAVGAVPARMFDTQLAAGVLGYGTPSLVSLLQGEIGVTPAKGDRLTDWLRRPLTDSQCQYAAADVEYLLEVHERLVAKLAEIDRLRWAQDACEELRTRPTSGSAPDDAWLRLKDARSLRPNARAVAQSVAAWRERRAMRTDIPVRQVLPDLAILGIAQRCPSNVNELKQARGVDQRHSRGAIAEEILEAVKAAKGAPAPARPRHRWTISTVRCDLRSRSCQRGWRNSPATNGSIRPCWPREPTSCRSCAGMPTPGWPRGGATISSVTAYAVWSVARPDSPSTREGDCVLHGVTGSDRGDRQSTGSREMRTRHRYPVPECQLSSLVGALS